MLLLSPSRYFLSRGKRTKDKHMIGKRIGSVTSSFSCSTASCESLSSMFSSSSRPRSETRDKYSSLTLRPYHPQQYGESDTDMEVDERAQWIDYHMDEGDGWTPSPSSLVLDLPHNCECKTRSTCPDFFHKHFIHVQTHERRRPVLLSAYLLSVDAYEQSRDALSRPTAKLERAKAEYDWTLSRQKRRLWSPRLQEQLSAAQKKIAEAEKEWESLSRRRWDKARSLVNIGRF